MMRAAYPAALAMSFPACVDSPDGSAPQKLCIRDFGFLTLLASVTNVDTRPQTLPLEISTPNRDYRRLPLK